MGCLNSVIVNAPADEVWDMIKDFYDMSWCGGVITKLKVMNDKASNEVGAKRILNDAFHETLLSIDNDAHRFSYSIDDGPGPVSKENVTGYVAEVTVYPVTENNTTMVLWQSKWEEDKEGSVADFCNPIYHAVLQELKSNFK